MRAEIETRISRILSAYRGIAVFLMKTPHAWVRVALVVLSCILGWQLGIAQIEWALLVLAGGLILVAEVVNTAIELAVDLASPGQHPIARDAKDVAAGAALLSSYVALLTWAVIFLPRLW